MISKILLSVLIYSSALAADPLFERMQGDWSGEGTRTQYISGNQTRIELRVSSRLEDNRLFTKNKVRETNSKGDVRVYEKNYWIRASAPGRYELGTGEDKVFSRGTWAAGAFAVTQKLGGEPAYVVYSETRFENANLADYDETLFVATQEVSRTRARFTRLR